MAPQASAGRRFRAYTSKHLDELTARAGFGEEERLAIRAVATVLPFRVNSYVIDELIDWDAAPEDRKSTRLNSSHVKIPYAVFCSKKKKNCKSLPAPSLPIGPHTEPPSTPYPHPATIPPHRSSTEVSRL